MNYIQQAFNYKHDFWRYIVGSLLIFLAVSIGQIPFTVAVFYKAYKEGRSLFTMGQNELMSTLEPNLNLFLLLLSFAIGFIGFWIVLKTLHMQTLVSITTGRTKVDWKRILFSFFFWGIISSVLVLADYYMNPEGYEYNFEMNRFLILVIIAVVLVPIQTSLEEYIFRGYLMQGFASGVLLKKFLAGLIISIFTLPIFFSLFNSYVNDLLGFIILSIGYSLIIFLIGFTLNKLNIYDSKIYKRIAEKLKYKWLPLLLTSSIFGLLHIANPEIEKLGYSLLIYYIGTGFFLGILTLMDDGMELALGFHAANNLFTALLVTANWTAFQTHSILKDTAESSLEFMDMILPVFIIFPIILFIFGRVYKWTNWKEKLFGKIEDLPKEDLKVTE